MFMIYFFRIPKGVLKKLDYYRFGFFLAKKYRLARWNVLWSPKCVGGPGITDLNVYNVCLLSKWLYKLINEDGVYGSRCLRGNIGKTKPSHK